MKHRPALAAGIAEPALVEEVFGPATPQVRRYWTWLATAGVERGLLGPLEADRLWDRHLLNSSAVSGFLPATGPVVDLGSGAGLPGIVVALLRPDLEVVLLEPLLRRCTFLSEVVLDLALERVTVVRGSAQEYARDHAGRATAVTVRAVAPLVRLTGWAAPLLAPSGRLVALKGRAAAEEIAAAASAMHDCGLSVEPPHVVEIGDTVTTVVCAELAGPGAGPTRSARRRKSR